MAGTGIGLPNTDSFATYGGAIANYPIGVIDPTTDEDAAIRNIYVANIAGMTHTIDRAIVCVMVPTSGQVGVTEGTGLARAAVWGDDASTMPVGTYIAVGTFDLIWPTMITDALGQTQLLAFKRARATIDSAFPSNFYMASAKVTAGNKVRVYTYDNTLFLYNPDAAGAAVTVWVR